MFGPFGVDAFALTNALSLLDQFLTRVQAPRDLLREATYLYERQSRVSEVNSRSAARSVPLASSALLEKHAFLLPGERSQSHSGGLLPPAVLRAAKIFLRRDCFHDALQTVSRLQNDELLEQFLRNQARILNVLDALMENVKSYPHLSNQISPCELIEQASELSKWPGLRFNSLSVDERKHYTPINSPPAENSSESEPLYPIWPPVTGSPPLFSDTQFLNQRFQVLLSIATSLTAAHSVKWYHTFVTPQMIQLPMDASQPTILLNFRNRGKGCKACGTCTQNPLSPPSRQDPFSFRDLTTAGTTARTPEQEDMLIFGNLVCWIYSSSLFDYAHPHSEKNIARLQCVPWPLRMLVTDALQIPLYVAHLWLSKLHKREIDPYSYQPPFCPYPAPHNIVSPPVSAHPNGHHPSDPSPDTAQQVLHECCLRSVVTASETADPQAALHLATYFELHHEHLARQQYIDSPDATNAFLRAYDYYLAAAKLGSLPALVHVARLQSVMLDRESVQIDPTPTVESVLALVLEAAFRGSAQAFQALSKVVDCGVRCALQPFKPSLNASDTRSTNACAEHSYVIEYELFNVIYRIALCLRRGTTHLPRREDIAVTLLDIAHRRRHSRSSLELGLYLVQTAHSLEEARDGMQILSELANTAPAEEGLQACFRLGRWLYYGLPHKFAHSNGNMRTSTHHSCQPLQPLQPLQQGTGDHAQAIHFVRIAAEGGLREAMVLYGTMLKKIASRYPDQDYLTEASKWIKEAGNCPMAYYAKALLLLIEAQKASKQQYSMNATVSFSSNASSSNPGNSTTSSTNAGNPPVPRTRSNRPKWRRKKPFDELMQNSSSGALGVLNIRNPSTLGAETSTEREPNQSEEDVLKQTIRNKFRKVHNILVDGPMELAKDFPGEDLNPYPYYKAADFMVRYGSMWAECDPKETEAALKEKALVLLRKVRDIPHSYRHNYWEDLRRNWREEDMFYVRKAQDLETKVFK